MGFYTQSAKRNGRGTGGVGQSGGPGPRSVVSKGPRHWRSARHMLKAITGTASSARSTTHRSFPQQTLIFTSQLQYSWEHLGSPGKSCVLHPKLLCTFYIFMKVTVLGYAGFACTSVFPTECERSEGQNNRFFFKNILESFYSFPSPLTTCSEPCHCRVG